MRAKIFKLAMGVLALVMTLASLSVIYAWYTNVSYVGSIDATTEGLSFYYTIDKGTVKNVKEYNIKNLAFFDPISTKEINYLSNMKSTIELKLVNNDEYEKNVVVEYSATKSKLGSGNAIRSIAYPAMVFSDSEALSTTGITNIDTLIADKSLITDDLFIQRNEFRLAGKGHGVNETIIYLHIFGIQEIPEATNEFLFDIKGNSIPYSFSIDIEARNIH